VTELALSGLVRVQLGKLIIIIIIIIMYVAKVSTTSPHCKKGRKPYEGGTGGLNRAIGKDNRPIVYKFQT
jgi:hypothetical protein